MLAIGKDSFELLWLAFWLNHAFTPFKVVQLVIQQFTRTHVNCPPLKIEHLSTGQSRLSRTTALPIQEPPCNLLHWLSIYKDALTRFRSFEPYLPSFTRIPSTTWWASLMAV
jgi:hypothetical protein